MESDVILGDVAKKDSQTFICEGRRKSESLKVTLASNRQIRRIDSVLPLVDDW